MPTFITIGTGAGVIAVGAMAGPAPGVGAMAAIRSGVGMGWGDVGDG